MQKQLDRPNPKTGIYHYSNSSSQNALICETPGFPDSFDDSNLAYASAYSDHIDAFSRDRFNEACKIATTADQGWATALPRLSNDTLREFARVALDLPVKPTHVRIVHHYNVSSGYSCPTVEALYSIS